jgi:hypothetical protein
MRTTVSLVLPVMLLATVARAADEVPTLEERKTIDALAKQAKSASAEAGLHPDARVAVKFEAPTNAQLAALKKYPNVGAVTALDASRLTEAGYAALKDLPHLRKLVLGSGAANDKTLAAVAECKHLRVLAVINDPRLPGVSDAGLANLKKLDRLESLDLSGNPRVTDKGMAAVRALERLEFLYLAETAITDKGLFELTPLDGLRTLNVTGTKVTSAGAEKFLDAMPNLRAVRGK